MPHAGVRWDGGASMAGNVAMTDWLECNHAPQMLSYPAIRNFLLTYSLDAYPEVRAAAWPNSVHVRRDRPHAYATAATRAQMPVKEIGSRRYERHRSSGTQQWGDECGAVCKAHVRQRTDALSQATGLTKCTTPGG